MGLAAKQPYGQQMTDWQAITSEMSSTGFTGSTMVFGDSRAKGPSLSNWKAIGLAPARMAVGGLTAEQILWTIQHTDPAWTANVKEVFLSAGANNFKNVFASSDNIAAAAFQCVKAIHKLIPGAQVYYVEIFEGAVQQGDSEDSRQAEVNQAMKAHTERYFHYVELPPLDPFDSTVYKPDHFHLTSYGNGNVLMPAIQQVRGLVGRGSDTADAAEPLRLGEGEVTGHGGDGADAIYGNAIANRLLGAAGKDLLVAAAGDDLLEGGAGGDRLYGGEGRDRTEGGKGADLLVGGAGRDLLTGGHGADVFRFTALTDGGDLIRDFNPAEGDRVDLSWIDADVHRDGDQHFRFAEAFTGRAGQAVLTYDAARDRTLLQLDVDGDARADFVLHIDGHAGPDAGWVL
ncbi:MAG TPA: M10 family metallopeptidase C-terminal domain-containing protein [Caulobacteraceae bacterium]|jgi:hypothetical protein